MPVFHDFHRALCSIISTCPSVSVYAEDSSGVGDVETGTTKELFFLIDHSVFSSTFLCNSSLTYWILWLPRAYVFLQVSLSSPSKNQVPTFLSWFIIIGAGKQQKVPEGRLAWEWMRISSRNWIFSLVTLNMWIAPTTLGTCSPLLQIQDHNFGNRGTGMWTAGQWVVLNGKFYGGRGWRTRSCSTMMVKHCSWPWGTSLEPVIRLLGLTTI